MKEKEKQERNWTKKTASNFAFIQFLSSSVLKNEKSKCYKIEIIVLVEKNQINERKNGKKITFDWKS